MEYAWEIIKLGTRDQENADGVILNDAVVLVTWKKIATDLRGRSSTYVGKTTLSAENVAAGDFVNLESLDEATILGWVKSSITPVEEEIMNNTLSTKIDKQEIVSRNPAWL